MMGDDGDDGMTGDSGDMGEDGEKVIIANTIKIVQPKAYVWFANCRV